MSPLPTLCTTGEAAEIVGVCAATLRRWASDGRVRHVVLPSGRLRFYRDDLTAILEPIEPRPAA